MTSEYIEGKKMFWLLYLIIEFFVTEFKKEFFLKYYVPFFHPLPLSVQKETFFFN